ncbi:Alkyl transferase [Balamuthia mandrillaris]
MSSGGSSSEEGIPSEKQSEEGAEEEDAEEEVEAESKGTSSGGGLWGGCQRLGRWFFAQVLSCGAQPKHIAFIMDGNRRFAQKKFLPRSSGHRFGYHKLMQALEWCLELGITTVTVYAFSIENFKRSQDEIDTLMRLATKKFRELLKREELIHKHGVRVNVLGDMMLLPLELQRVMAKAIYATRHNTKAVLNVCFAYTSREEMLHAMNQVASGVNQNMLKSCDVTEQLFEKSMYMADYPDIIIRTSGEKRLSDFLLWQGNMSSTMFLEVLWPEFSPWHLYYCILCFQADYAALSERRKQYRVLRDREQRMLDLQQLIQEEAEEMRTETKQEIETEMEQKMIAMEEKMKLKKEKAKEEDENKEEEEFLLLNERLSRFEKEREERIQRFLRHQQEQHMQYILRLVKSSGRSDDNSPSTSSS